ncbi:MAG: hypothetical protein HQM16_10345 [Deltaproteobacteria bacterium]|nr:hypothetical protein [Deltaproteobacteria bacterium]
MLPISGQFDAVAVQMRTMAGLLGPQSTTTLEQVHSGLSQYATTLRSARVPEFPLNDMRDLVARYGPLINMRRRVGGLPAFKEAVHNALRSASCLPLPNEPDESFFDRLDLLSSPQTQLDKTTVMVMGVKLYIGHAAVFTSYRHSQEFAPAEEDVESGAYANVTKIYHKATGHVFAKKTYGDRKRPDQYMLHLLPELRFQCGAPCKALLQVFRYGTDIEQGSPYILMPFIEQKWQPSNTLTAVMNMLRGAALLHDRGMLIGDLSFKNILRTQTDEMFFADVGEAMFEGEAPLYPIDSGTRAYVSPERAEAHGWHLAQNRMALLTAGDNVFSLGAVIYQMITGILPHRPKINEGPVSLELVFGHPLFPVIEKALHSDPRQRYQNAREMYNDALRIIAL